VKNGDSEIPSATRAAYRKPKELARAESIEMMDQRPAAQANMRLGPYLSTR
jgi:hypothetical protein